jgi:hypothetical protein
MTAILRSPEISQQKRKLSTPRARAAHAVAEIVLGGEAAEHIQAPDPDLLKSLSAREVKDLVKQAATHALNSEKVVVRLHAADLAMLREAGALDASLPSGALVTWVADKAVALGGCVIETDGGELDARLETQIDRLRSALVIARKSEVAVEPDFKPERRKKRVANYLPERRTTARKTGEG